MSFDSLVLGDHARKEQKKIVFFQTISILEVVFSENPVYITLFIFIRMLKNILCFSNDHSSQIALEVA